VSNNTFFIGLIIAASGKARAPCTEKMVLPPTVTGAWVAEAACVAGLAADVEASLSD
jgi:hypothetical protein